MSEPKTRILVVDDDLRLRDLLQRYLTEQGFGVHTVPDAAGMDKLLARERVDLLVLDLMLPGEDGLTICRRLRGGKNAVPIIMLTAKGEDVDRIVGLQMGADDYLPKPFNPLELVARISAVLRRAQTEPVKNQDLEILVLGDIEMDNRTRTVRRANEVVELTVVEYSLLAKFLGAPGRIIEREELVKEVLHRNLSPFDRSIDTHVSNLRKKLGHQVNGVERIKTVRGIGYIYASAAEMKLD